MRVGDYDATSDPDCSEFNFCAPSTINHRISYIIVHPDYVQGEYHHDIALVVLKQPMNYSGNKFFLRVKGTQQIFVLKFDKNHF